MSSSSITLPTDDAPHLRLRPSHEEQMLREAVRGVVGEFGPDYYQRVSREGGSAHELMRALGEHGYLGVHLPVQFGGGGLGIAELAIVLEESAAVGCPSLPIVWSPGIIGTIIARHGSPEQQSRWLADVAVGKAMMSFALTEAEAGSNSHNVRTTARREGDGYVLSGQKHYISGVEEADAILVVARTGTDGRSGRGLLSLFLVDADAPGLTRQAIPTAVEMPDSQWTLFFDDVVVPETGRIGAENAGLRIVFDGLNPERVMAAALACGVGRYALDKAVAYATERDVWGRPIGAHQAIAHPLAEGKIMLEQARLMTQKAAALFDAGEDAGEAANMCKFAAAEAATHCLDHAIQTHGGNGLALEYQLSNYWFLVRLLRVAPVSREMVLNFVAEHTLGLPRSY